MGRGLFARVEIEPGEVIISVPWSNVFASQALQKQLEALGCDKRDFMWAVQLLLSRCFYYGPESRHLAVPGIDMCNHSHAPSAAVKVRASHRLNTDDVLRQLALTTSSSEDGEEPGGLDFTNLLLYAHGWEPRMQQAFSLLQTCISACTLSALAAPPLSPPSASHSPAGSGESGVAAALSLGRASQAGDVHGVDDIDGGWDGGVGGSDSGKTAGAGVSGSGGRVGASEHDEVAGSLNVEGRGLQHFVAWELKGQLHRLPGQSTSVGVNGGETTSESLAGLERLCAQYSDSKQAVLRRAMAALTGPA
ncbi:MAG: hypothetical protein WDW38_006090 [Sanguina aurantia]